MNKGTILTGFLHFRPPNKASGRLFELILDSTDLENKKSLPVGRLFFIVQEGVKCYSSQPSSNGTSSIGISSCTGCGATSSFTGS